MVDTVSVLWIKTAGLELLLADLLCWYAPCHSVQHMMMDADSKVVLDCLALLNSQLNLDSLLPAVLDIALTVTGGERAFLMLSDTEGGLSSRVARNREKQNVSEHDFHGSTSIIRLVLEKKEPLYFPRLLEAQEFVDSRSIREFNLQSAICIPLWRYPREHGEALIGVLYVDSFSRKNPLGEEQLQLISLLANHMAISIENAKLFDEVKRQKSQIADLNWKLQQRVEAQAGKLTEVSNLLAETQRELGRSYTLGSIVGKSKPMLRIFRILEKVARTDATVLILGESGTGKELIAKHLHYSGSRAAKPLVSINCSAFNDPLLESELFGHTKGAFTGAVESKMGLFQLADGGTLFLDEVGDMSIEMQKKLLRVLQEGEVRPIGSRQIHKVDVRILAATNCNLKEMVQDGNFREDLYFRLNVICFTLPPLRERREDIPLLLDYFSKKISNELKRPAAKFSDGTLKKFLEYDWPGNIRELENELRRAFILESEYHSEQLQPAEDGDQLSLASAERKAILKAIEAAGGNRRRAAEMLGIPRSSFYEKLAKYNIG